ncbi:hypothetical protein EVAR_95852_1 [Eumeta japonica]|uniref:Uncharacterized protein n=1 Tax=Eumeta variegata TaxID=151549 RepID=A0A4C1VLJ9_EUMVA|nr:hypothetical protein EVAR_95852_1 [Eumeta japonica]
MDKHVTNIHIIDTFYSLTLVIYRGHVAVALRRANALNARTRSRKWLPHLNPYPGDCGVTAARRVNAFGATTGLSALGRALMKHTPAPTRFAAVIASSRTRATTDRTIFHVAPLTLAGHK